MLTVSHLVRHRTFRAALVACALAANISLAHAADNAAKPWTPSASNAGWPKYDLVDLAGGDVSIASPYYLRRIYIPLAEWFAVHTGAPEWTQALRAWTDVADRAHVPANVLP